MPSISVSSGSVGIRAPTDHVPDAIFVRIQSRAWRYGVS